MERINTKIELQLLNALEHLEGARREVETLTKAGFRAPGNQADLEFKLLKMKTIIKEAQVEVHKLLLAEKTYLNNSPQRYLQRPALRKLPTVKRCGGCGQKR